MGLEKPELKNGRQYASGTFVGASTITVSGLKFRPATIIIRNQSGASPNYQDVYSSIGDANRYNQSHFAHQTTNANWDTLAQSGSLAGMANKITGLFTITDTGFTLTYSVNAPVGNVDWEAFSA